MHRYAANFSLILNLADILETNGHQNLQKMQHEHVDYQIKST